LEVLVTTEKDRTRLGTLMMPVPIYTLRIRMAPVEENELMAMVNQRLSGVDFSARAENP